MNLPVLILNPHSLDTAARNSQRVGKITKANPSVALRHAARYVKDIRSAGPGSHMGIIQFSDALLDANGRTITKPTGW